jgi:VanZ family protein
MKLLSYQSWLANRTFLRVFCLVFLLALVAYEGGRPGPEASGEVGALHSYCANLVHQPLFALIALFSLLVLGQACRSAKAFLLGVSFALLVGIFDELHQDSIPFRDSSVWDLGSDVLGATFGILVAGWSDLHGGLRARWLPIVGLLTLSLLWNLLPSFASPFPLPFTG